MEWTIPPYKEVEKLIFNGQRKCSQCGSEKVVAVSTPDLDNGPFPLAEVGKHCLCEPCLLDKLKITARQ